MVPLPSSVTPRPLYTPPVGAPPPRPVCTPSARQTSSIVSKKEKVGGRSKASVPSDLLFELPWSALNPKPLAAKASHISHRCAPP